MNKENQIPEDEAVYVISVASELSGMHPQTLRQYDRLGNCFTQQNCWEKPKVLTSRYC
jgi:hypothetical protein